MKTLIIALALISTQASAGTYAKTAQRQLFCHGQGDFAESVYKLKVDFDTPLEEIYEISNSPNESAKERAAYRKIIKEAYNAVDAVSANTLAWANCMDEYSAKTK